VVSVDTELWCQGTQICGVRGHRSVVSVDTELWCQGTQICGVRGHRTVVSRDINFVILYLAADLHSFSYRFIINVYVTSD